MPVSSWTATSARSWRFASSGGGSAGWRWDDANRAYQGQWENYGRHKGLWFFNDASIRSTLANQDILRVRLRLGRDGGGVTAAQTPTIRMHNYASQPAGEPSVTPTASTAQDWAVGETAWTTLPNSWGNLFRDNSAKGIAVYTTSNSPYMIFFANAILEITYEPQLDPPPTPNVPSIYEVSQTYFVLTTNVTPRTDTWEWNPQDAGANFAVRDEPVYSRPGQAPGTTVNVRVRARNVAGVSSYSGYRAILLVPATPSIPSTVSRGTSNITMSTPSVVGATSYDWAVNGSVAVSNTGSSVNFTGLSPNTPYTFEVRTKNASGVTPWSLGRTVSTLLPAPEVPGGLRISNLTETSLTISWDSVSFADSYDLEHEGTVIRSSFAGTSTNVTGLSDGTTHSFRVRSRNSTAVSGWSSPVQATTPSIWTTPGQPSGVGPSEMITTSRPTLTATAPSQPQGLLQRIRWQVSRSSDFSSPWTFLGSYESSGERTYQVPPESSMVDQGGYYVRARVEHTQGGIGPWSSGSEYTFTRLRVWTGSQWEPRLINVWTGSGWEETVLRVHGSSSWT